MDPKDTSIMEVSMLVKKRLRSKGLTLQGCCDAFNKEYSLQIAVGEITPLNKDFLSRVARGQFKVCSGRISKLCDFLDVGNEREHKHPLQTLVDQIGEFDQRSKRDIEFRKDFFVVRKFLSGLNLDKIMDNPRNGK